MDDYEFKDRYFHLLKEKYPTQQDLCTQIINLEAILSLPKGTEHFISDVHGEYESFDHIMNNCSGVIKEKVDMLFKNSLKKNERQELCTLIYYPEEKLNELRQHNKLCGDWYRMTLQRLIDLTSLLSSKYTRSKVRKVLPKQFGYILDELMHSKDSQDLNIKTYQESIIETIIRIDNGDAFINEIVKLIKRLAVSHLHIIGDIYDRGARADSIIDLLMDSYSLDIQWGNHDILWMGAAAGNKQCVAAVIYNNLRYQNYMILESGYGISLRNLMDYSKSLYGNEKNIINPIIKTIGIILFKLEGQLIQRNSQFKMESRLLLDKINFNQGTIVIDNQIYTLKDTYLPTLDKNNPYILTSKEEKIIKELTESFVNSIRLKKHIEFLLNKGSVYKIYNQNLLYHGCIPLTEDGNFKAIEIYGKMLQGKQYLDFIDNIVRSILYGKTQEKYKDFMYFLWCGRLSPFSGRACRTFENEFIEINHPLTEEVNSYYKYHDSEKVCDMILHEFQLYSNQSHIINGHIPIKYKDGEQPLKANGKLILIDGGFCEAYQSKTGIAGYTLIYNSHGLRIKAHSQFENRETAYRENKDIISDSHILETSCSRVMVRDTDEGKQMEEEISRLLMLLSHQKNDNVYE